MEKRSASLLRRLGAMIYDTLLLFALLSLATIPFIAMRGGEYVASNDNLAYQLTLVGVVYVFFVGYWTGSGRTLGMQSWGLRVENPDGSLPSLATASIRLAAAVVSLLAFGLGFLWQLWDREGLTWHDRISRTRLVHYPKPPKRPES